MLQRTGLNPWRAFDEVFNRLESGALSPNGDPAGNVGSAAFPIDVIEGHDHLLVQVSLPGVKADGVDLSLEGNTLTLTARLEEAAPEGTRYLWRERPAGQVRRAISLPVRLSPDGVQADLEDGVLTVRLAKAPEATARKIAVSGGDRNKAITG